MIQCISKINKNFLTFSAVLGVMGRGIPATAQPADIFKPYVEQIQYSLPSGWSMRLPGVLQFRKIPQEESAHLKVRVFPTKSPPGLTVSLFGCAGSPHSCLVSSFAVDARDSANAQREFQKHQQTGVSVELDNGVKVFMADGATQKPPSPFTTAMWEQDGMFYTVSFLSLERESMLNAIASMSKQPPIQPLSGDRQNLKE